MAPGNQADPQKQNVNKAGGRSSGVAEWEFRFRKVSCEIPGCLLSNDFHEQLAENQIGLELGRDELNVSFQAGLKALNQFGQLKTMHFTRSQSKRIGI